MDDRLQKFDDPDNDRSSTKHIGRNPKITKSILESENYRALLGRLYDDMHRFFSNKNIVVMTCRSGRGSLEHSAEQAQCRTAKRSARRACTHKSTCLHCSHVDLSRFASLRVLPKEFDEEVVKLNFPALGDGRKARPTGTLSLPFPETAR